MSVVGLKSLDVSPSNELLLLPMIVKNCFASEYFFLTSTTFGVHYRTGSPGQLQGSPGRWITGSLGRWVTKWKWPKRAGQFAAATGVITC